MFGRIEIASGRHGDKGLRVLGWAVGTLVLGSAAVQAAPITIVNANFQTVDAFSVDGDIPGFTATASFAAIYNVPGYNVLDLNAPGNDATNGQGSVYQVLTATFAPVTYSFSSGVQSPYYGEYNGNVGDNFNGGEQISLVDATTSSVIDTDTFTPTDTARHWVTLDFTVDPGDPEVGDPIELVITHTGEGDVFLNDISLSVPEPASIALLTVGVAGVAARRRTVRR